MIVFQIIAVVFVIALLSFFYVQAVALDEYYRKKFERNKELMKKKT